MPLFVDIKKNFAEFRLSAQIEGANEVVALLGGSGCGKSLALKCIAGIETPDEGQVIINGETVFDSEKRINFPPQKRRVGYLFQNYALFPNMTVRGNISSVITKKEKRGMLDSVIKSLRLEDVENLYPRQISGGQQQRVALARILVYEPSILLLDEPFSALDSHLKWWVEQELTSILADFSGTTVFVSHDRDEVFRISDKIVVMAGGKVESAGDKNEIFAAPKTLAAAMITGCKNFSRAEKVGKNLVTASDWGVTLQTESPVPDNIKHIAVRAHHFKLSASETNNAFPCRIHRIIDKPFGKTLELSAKNSNGRFFVEVSNEFEFSSANFFAGVPSNKIMCLEGDSHV